MEGTVDMSIGVGRLPPHGEADWDETEGRVEKLRIRKYPCIDGISAEILKWEGDGVLEWMVWICNPFAL